MICLNAFWHLSDKNTKCRKLFDPIHVRIITRLFTRKNAMRFGENITLAGALDFDKNVGILLCIPKRLKLSMRPSKWCYVRQINVGLTQKTDRLLRLKIRVSVESITEIIDSDRLSWWWKEIWFSLLDTVRTKSIDIERVFVSIQTNCSITMTLNNPQWPNNNFVRLIARKWVFRDFGQCLVFCWLRASRTASFLSSRPFNVFNCLFSLLVSEKYKKSIFQHLNIWNSAKFKNGNGRWTWMI